MVARRQDQLWVQVVYAASSGMWRQALLSILTSRVTPAPLCHLMMAKARCNLRQVNKPNRKSSTEAELVRVNNMSVMILWNKKGWLLEVQDKKIGRKWYYIGRQWQEEFQQENPSIEHSLFISSRSSGGRKCDYRTLSSWWYYDQDFHTKPLQSKKFHVFGDTILRCARTEWERLSLHGCGTSSKNINFKIINKMNEDHTYIIVSYTTNQEGQDIWDVNMAWPVVNHCLSYWLAGDEIRKANWRAGQDVLPITAVVNTAWRTDLLVNPVMNAICRNNQQDMWSWLKLLPQTKLSGFSKTT